MAMVDCCGSKKYYQLFPITNKSLRQEMWLADFQMRSTKKLEVHCNIHLNGQGP